MNEKIEKIGKIISSEKKYFKEFNTRKLMLRTVWHAEYITRIPF